MGIVGAGSGCWDVAREVTSPFVLRDGVQILPGTGEGALVVSIAIAGDYKIFSLQDTGGWKRVPYGRAIGSAVTHHYIAG